MKTGLILFSDVVKTRFMQDVDMFESFKVVIAGEAELTVVDDFGEKHIEAMLAHCQNEPYRVIAVDIPNHYTWKDPNVQSISNGIYWDLLENWPKTRLK